MPPGSFQTCEKNPNNPSKQKQGKANTAKSNKSSECFKHLPALRSQLKPGLGVLDAPRRAHRPRAWNFNASCQDGEETLLGSSCLLRFNLQDITARHAEPAAESRHVKSAPRKCFTCQNFSSVRKLFRHRSDRVCTSSEIQE